MPVIPATQEAEAGGYQLQAQPGQHGETCLKTKNKTKPQKQMKHS
jgi:hypothetical protein